jgi:poly(3-hydroxybutyrate) depolymerase
MSGRRLRAIAMSALGIISMALGTVLIAPAPSASAAALTEITNFGTNPTNLRMHLYVPDRVAPKPAVLVAVHYCTGSGPAFYSGTEFARMADRYGFIIVYPTATRASKCFDVSSPQALRHDGTADDTLRYPNFTEEIKQWTNVAGIPQTPTTSDSPQPNWNRTRYNIGGTVQVEGVSIQGGTHNVPTAGMAQYVMDFFGLSGDQPPPPPGDNPCRVTYTTSTWNTGLTANITIANTGTSAVSGWSLGFTLPAGQTITSGWGATYAPAAGAVIAKNVPYNATVAAGASIGIGLQASHTGDSGKPASFTLNGATCATS